MKHDFRRWMWREARRDAPAWQTWAARAILLMIAIWLALEVVKYITQ